jgi:hypothetical protein
MRLQAARGKPGIGAAAIARSGRHGYNCGRREVRGGIMDVLLALIVGFILGVVVGYGIREIISRRHRAAARMTAQPELYRELDGNQTLRLE